MARALYRGYSSHEFMRTGSFKLNDVELVKMDLLNHIFTLKGTRPMMRRFGTNIPTLLFEPMDDMVLESLEDELKNVFEYDPRVETLAFEVIPDFTNGSIRVHAKLDYIELDTVDDFEINLQFEN